MNHKAWMTYAMNGYQADLATFMQSGALRHDNHYTLRQGNYLVVCDANPHRFAEAVDSSNLVDRDRFVVGLTLDAILLAGVHAYDRQHFAKYCDALPVIVHVEAHPWAGVKRPQVLFTAVSRWCPTTLSILSAACSALLPRWAVLYGRLVGDATAGARIVGALARDEDLAANPYELLPEAVMHRLRTGVAKAAMLIG